jgi:tripartite-type tricarboxylate transporter receptor subunit TctC
MKKYLALILALCMVFALCACGSSGTTATTATEAPAAEAADTETTEATETTSEGWAPTGPVTMIVAYKAGNGTDVTARILAQYAEKYIGQTIVIENVDGGSGSIGWSQLASADPDGQTIGFMNLPNFNSSIVKELGTYTTDDFAAICNHVTETSIVICRADEDRFDDIEGLVAYAKENSTVASTNGAQASNHIGAQAFANSAGFTYIDNPQGNTADEITSLLGKESDWCVVKVADIAGRSDVKVLASFSTERLEEYPDVPTLGELGYYDQWLGSSRCIVAPAGVSDEVIAFYEAAFKATMEDPDYLAAASEFATDYKDAAETAALIEQQQAFTESLSEGFWYD